MSKPKLFLVLIFLSIMVVVYQNQGQLKVQFDRYFYYSPCDSPVKYKIGSIDSKFHLSQDELIADLDQASQIWNRAEGKKLLQFNPQTAQLEVEMIYDDRQALKTQINQLEGNLKQTSSSLQPSIAEYDKLTVDFKQRLQGLNNQIEKINKRGGATQDEYNQITNEQNDLKALAEKLNQMAKDLNKSTNLYNQGVSQLDQTMDTFNQALDLRPEEGLYKPAENKIEIYFYVTRNELIHTLAHELGHALGLNHNINQKSIMYPKSTEQVTLSQEDLNDLTIICQKKSLVYIYSQKLKNNIEFLFKTVNLLFLTWIHLVVNR